ncbi:MAG: serine dehydratase beta chain, partial [Candidatus Cloacimonetes bacterium]|nr:serine dehydratase beta chain [Candidatus Cloacimonadota bacterium]
MESIKEIFRIGYGPSSSHTMGPRNAAEIFHDRYPLAMKMRVTLFGSMAATGRGHQTDKAIIEAMDPQKVELVWKPETYLEQHPNGILFEALDVNSNVMGEWLVFSVGGGKITDFNIEENENLVYDFSSMNEILEWSIKSGKSLWEYVLFREGESILDYLEEVWNIMQDAINKGIDAEGIIPGGLRISRKASSYYVKAKNYTGSLKGKTLIFSYALAVAEENACGGKIVTAPTCGSAGVLAAVVYHLSKEHKFTDKQIIWSLATAG